jgi:hypothetical protein
MTNETLGILIDKIKEKCPECRLSTQYYINMLKADCVHVTEKFWDEAAHYYDTNECYDKPIVYLRAILLNKQKEFDKRVLKEETSLGSIPLPKF